jgi:hypothetical protein
MNTVNIAAELLPLIPGFLQRREDDCLQLHEFLNDHNFVSINTIAHRLQGNGTAYGFPEISKFGYELGDAAKKQDCAKIRATIHCLEMTVRDLKELFVK